MDEAQGIAAAEDKRGRELMTWGEIATYLGQSVRNVQRWEQLGLPVHRMLGKKSRVFAFTHELDSWKARNAVLAAIPSDASAGHDLATDQSTARSADQPEVETGAGEALVPARSGPQPWKYLVWAAAAVLVIGLASALHFWKANRRPPADFRVSGNNLIALDSEGRELWRHRFDIPLAEAAYTQEGRRRLGWAGELVKHDGGDLVFRAMLLNASSVTGRVYCFDRNGRVKWQFEPGRAVTDRGGSQMVPPYYSSGIVVLAGRSPELTRIAVCSHHYLEQPNQVAFLDVNGHVTGEYWHPGQLLEHVQADLGGRTVLILGGVNNGEHRATLVILDPLKVKGLMTPKVSSDQRFELLNMAPANEEAVALFPRSCIAKDQPFTRVQSLRVTPERVVVALAEGPGGKEPGFVYEFDHALRLLDVTPTGPDVMNRHRELEQAHELNHPFSADVEDAQLKAGVVMRWGDPVLQRDALATMTSLPVISVSQQSWR